MNNRNTNLDASCGLHEVDGIRVVLFYTCANRKDIGVEDDVIGVEANFTDEEIVCSRAYLHFPLSLSRL